MMGVVKAFGSENFLASNEDQLIIRWDTQDLIRGHQLPATEGVGLAVGWCVVRDAHGVEIAHGAFHLDRGDTDAVADVFCCEDVRTAEEDRGIAGTNDLLPLVVRVAVLHLTDVLKEDCDGHAA